MFYDKYIALCEKRNISPAGAAIAIGFDKSAVTYWRRQFYKGKDVAPSSDIVVRMAEYFNVSTDYLLGSGEDYQVLRRVMSLLHIDRKGFASVIGISEDDVNSYMDGIKKVPAEVMETIRRVCVENNISLEDVGLSEEEITVDRKFLTDAGYRDVFLFPELEKMVLSLNLSPKQYIVTRSSELPTQSAVRRRWQKYCMERGMATRREIEVAKRSKTTGEKTIRNEIVPTIDRHQIRHEYATMLFEADVDAKTAQAILGHADLTTTLKIYTHIRDRSIEEARTKMQSYLASSCEKKQPE